VGSTISSLIGAAESGDSAAADTLFSTLYTELHRMAKRELARQGSPPSLSVTTLLHEAYLDIAAREGSRFPDRPRFMGYAARVMRGLIIDLGDRWSFFCVLDEAGKIILEQKVATTPEAMKQTFGKL
jgi:DNA-directed RNA polymerase specialized sigma24 family protein